MITGVDVRDHARQLIARRAGLDFSERRVAQLDRALLAACRQAGGKDDVGAYLAMLERLPTGSREWARLVARLTVGETYFFRDRTFAVLERVVLPELIAQRDRMGARFLRMWSAGCATGEEPYSLAMLVDRLLAGRSGWSVTILGTDVDASALAAADAGTYRAWSLRETPAWARDRYFRPTDGGTFDLDGRIRAMVTFNRLNLAEPGYPSAATDTAAMDLILCRNVLMYLTPRARRETVGRLQAALVDGGLLTVSPAESSAELMAPLTFQHMDGAILFRKARAAPLAARRATTTPAPETPARSPERPGTPASAPRAAATGERDAALAAVRAVASRGELGRARAACLDAIARDRLDPESHLLLAAIAQEQGDIEVALSAVRAAIYLRPDMATAHFLLAALLIANGDTARGRRVAAGTVRLLDGAPPDELVHGSDGISAGQMRGLARSLLEAG